METPKSQVSLEEAAHNQAVASGSLDEWLVGPWSESEDEEVNAFLALRGERKLPHLSKIKEDAEAFAP